METFNIPRSKSKFHEWANAAYLYATSSINTIRWILSADAVSQELTNSYSDYNTKYPIAANPETHTYATIMARNYAKKRFARNFCKYLKTYIVFNSHVTDEDKKNN
jgi:hypothetical protein